MKIASLLAPYLFREKRLDLPRIGSFVYTPSPTIEGEKSKHTTLGSVEFSRNASEAEAQKLILYISEQTGKMKPLATSDLSSFTDLAVELINTGKPFHLESIGTLVKQSDGDLSFLPALGEPERAREKAVVIDSKSGEKAISKPRNTSKQPLNQKPVQSNNSAVLVTAVIIGLALAIGGGYVFTKNKSRKPVATEPIGAEPIDKPDIANRVQVASIPKPSDTLQNTPETQSVASTTYKFVYETTNSKKRALRRYAQVHELIPSIQLEALQDSSLFKIFVRKQSEDTSRTKLELKAWYYGTAAKQVTIE